MIEVERQSGVLVCRGLCVNRGRRPVLHDIELTLGPAECVTLIGPNGCGKTTLLLTLLGLLRPQRGQVTLDGVPLRHLSATRRGWLAAYVPQTIERLPAFTVYDVVAAGRYPHVPPLRPLGQADRAAVDAALAQCGLTELALRPVNALSGGERQKALIAAAIAQDAQFMFLDEPNTALDPAYQVELATLLRQWHTRGRGLVLISHDLQLPGVLGGRVVALRAGRIAADGPAAEVLQPDRLATIYGAAFDEATTRDGRRFVVPRWDAAPSGP